MIGIYGVRTGGVGGEGGTGAPVTGCIAGANLAGDIYIITYMRYVASDCLASLNRVARKAARMKLLESNSF